MNGFINTFFAPKPSGGGSRSGKSPYGSRRAAGSEADLTRYARDNHDSFEQAKERFKSPHRSSKAPEPPKATQMYYVDPTKTYTSSRSSTSRSNTPQPFVPPGVTSTPSAPPVPFPSSTGGLSRTYVQPLTQPQLQAGITPRRRTQSMSHSQAPDPNMFTQYLRKGPKQPKTIYFYDKKKAYYSFTNFAPYPVMYEGKEYPTSEHLFQAFKFLPHRPQLAEHIRTAGDRPSIPFMEARRFEPEVRPDWRSVNLEKMDEVLGYKFGQHPGLMKELLSTGDAILVEDSRGNDAFWGNGADGKGLNHLGYALMSLRERHRRR